jgi:SAM-dependent methyltransferase
MSLFLPYNQEREETYIGENATRPIDAINLVLPKLIPGFKVTRVLDLGTGPGDFVKYALEQGLDAYGVDIRDIFKGDRTRFRQADIRKRIPFPDGYFDLVFEHLFFDDLIGLQKLSIEEVKKAVYETHRVTRKRGYLFTEPPTLDETILNPQFERIFLDPWGGTCALYQMTI